MSSKIIIMLVLFLSVLSGCQSSMPESSSGFTYSPEEDGLSAADYKVMGVINYDNAYGEGYQGMLEAAKEVYPGTTDVIDIIPASDMSMLSGVAIQRITA